MLTIIVKKKDELIVSLIVLFQLKCLLFDDVGTSKQNNVSLYFLQWFNTCVLVKKFEKFTVRRNESDSAQ